MSDPEFLPSECDVIMEGGVTSGVVFPTFISGLARRFTLRSIGGTSVGAVAAVAAAAAQFNRNATLLNTTRNGTRLIDDGFEKLAGIPKWLQESSTLGRSNLFSLFQPCRDLEPQFKLLQTILNQKGNFSTIFRICLSLIRIFPKGASIGVLLAISWSALKFVLIGASYAQLSTVYIFLVFAWLGIKTVLLAVVLSFVECIWQFFKGLRKNRCGICSGISEKDEGGSKIIPALTEWLHNLVQDIANLPENMPLTFGALRESSPPIELAFITTGISEMRSHRLPMTGEDLLFRVSEMKLLFPKSIVDALVGSSRQFAQVSADSMKLLRQADAKLETDERDLYFMPSPDDWPIVFAARLSLSFPILLQAVPLYRIRFVAGDGHVPGYVGVKKIWLSDGGLTSNFPIHFFDSMLPSRPTFGISLENTLSEKAEPEKRVYLPKNNLGGITGAYLEIDDINGLPTIGGFGIAILQTIRLWRDGALKRTPGFRDRIVQVRHTKEEGGLNLNMPVESIQAMSESGEAAANLIIKRFCDVDAKENGWLNHRWVRMRIAAALMQKYLKPMVDTWTSSNLHPSYKAMWAGNTSYVAGSYRLKPNQIEPGNIFWDQLAATTKTSLGTDFSNGMPKPEPTLGIAPKQT